MRRYTRVPFLRRARVHLESQDVEVCCLDLSLRGILLTQPEHHLDLGSDQTFEVTLVVSDAERVRFYCREVHSDWDVFGCSIEYIGLRDIALLTRILQLNLPDWCCPAEEWNHRVNENGSFSRCD